MSAIGPIRASSTSRADWRTPRRIFDKLDAEFHFNLDAAADADNALCERFLSGPHSPLISCACALCISWKDRAGFGVPTVAFLNPPYGTGESKCVAKCKKKRCVTRGHHQPFDVPGLMHWEVKCFLESEKGATVVALLPDSLDTQWFRMAFNTAWEIRIVEGRIQFDEPGAEFTEDPVKQSNTGGSLVVVWRPGVRPYASPIFSMWAQP